MVEGMRKQRMGLCQSLHEYLFVHSAILEDALRIVDEEKAREAEEVRGRRRVRLRPP